ncbi:MAG: hypothetical protein OXG04_21795, partial [Acidobacteria bacterium]|nr:hypothetical protein [Acidobacteriota bacterium]
FFEVLGAPAAEGVSSRFPGADARAVVSTPLARAIEDETGRSALGQAVTVGDRRYDVAAVMGDDFAFPSADVDVWLLAPEGSGGYRLVGRMPEGTTIAHAGDDADRVAREIQRRGLERCTPPACPHRLRGLVLAPGREDRGERHCRRGLVQATASGRGRPRCRRAGA